MFNRRRPELFLPILIGLWTLSAGVLHGGQNQPAESPPGVAELDPGKWYSVEEISAHVQAAGHQPLADMNRRVPDAATRSEVKRSAIVTATGDRASWYLLQGDAPRGEAKRFRLVLSGTGLEVNDYRTAARPSTSLYDAAIQAYVERADERVAVQGRMEGGRVFTLLADPADGSFRLVRSSPGGVASPFGLGADFIFSEPVMAAFEAGNPTPARTDAIAWNPGACGPLTAVDALLAGRGLTDVVVRANLVERAGENRRLFGSFIAATPDRKEWVWLYGEKPRGEGSETGCVYATGSALDLRDYVSFKKVYESQIDLGEINGEDYIGVQGRLNEFFSDKAWEQYEELIALGGAADPPDPPVDSVAAGHHFRGETALAACLTLEHERWREICEPYKQLVRQLKHDSGLHLAVQGEANIRDSKSIGILTLMAHDKAPYRSILLFTTFEGATIRYMVVQDLEFSPGVLAGFESPLQ